MIRKVMDKTRRKYILPKLRQSQDYKNMFDFEASTYGVPYFSIGTCPHFRRSASRTSPATLRVLIEWFRKQLRQLARPAQLLAWIVFSDHVKKSEASVHA